MAPIIVLNPSVVLTAMLGCAPKSFKVMMPALASTHLSSVPDPYGPNIAVRYSRSGQVYRPVDKITLEPRNSPNLVFPAAPLKTPRSIICWKFHFSLGIRCL